MVKTHIALAGALLVAAGCQSQPAAGQSAVAVQSIYSKETGRLEQMTVDTNADGKADTIASLDGTRLNSIAIDRDHDGRADRWEYYAPAGPGQGAISNPADRWALRIRAEESNRPDGAITRWEFYEHGVIQRVEEDTDLDRRVDKWEFYANAVLARVDLDLAGKGQPDRRLVYSPDGNVDRVEWIPTATGSS